MHHKSLNINWQASISPAWRALPSLPKFESDKISCDSLYFYKNIPKKLFDLLRDTQNTPSPDSWNNMQGSADQERVTRLGINIEWGGKEGESHNFCRPL